jgi:hypothetical protein
VAVGLRLGDLLLDAVAAQRATWRAYPMTTNGYQWPPRQQVQNAAHLSLPFTSLA